MALRALGRSRVMTATPLGWTAPLTKSSAEPAMAENRRGFGLGLGFGFGERALERKRKGVGKDEDLSNWSPVRRTLMV